MQREWNIVQMMNGNIKVESKLDEGTKFTVTIFRIAVESYCEQDFSEKLSTFFEEKDLPNYQIVIHGVKSTSLTIGLRDLSEQAKQLEMACKENNWEYVEGCHAKVYDKYVDALTKLRSVL